MFFFTWDNYALAFGVGNIDLYVFRWNALRFLENGQNMRSPYAGEQG